MGVFAWQWRTSFIAIPIAVGILTYLALLLVLRIVPREEVDMIRWFGRSALRRVRLRLPGWHAGGS